MLTLNNLSKEAREILSELALSRKEREDIINGIADEMTYDHVADFVLHIKKENPPDGTFSEVDRVLFTVRQAYLVGFANAIDIYSNTIEMGIREPKGGKSND